MGEREKRTSPGRVYSESNKEMRETKVHVSSLKRREPPPLPPPPPAPKRELMAPQFPPPPAHQPRLIVYHQTIYQGRQYVDLFPLLTEDSGVTHVIIAAIHINGPKNVTLNDDPWYSPKFKPLWDDVSDLKANGIKVMGMLGGAARGTFLRLDADNKVFEEYYKGLREMLVGTGLEGLDLDVEEAMSLGGIIRLIDCLRHDFGPDFIITLAPVAPGMKGQQNLHGFDIEVVEKAMGRHISWYNTQFYCGWGDMKDTAGYEAIIARGWPQEKVVVGLVTNPENGAGYVVDEDLKKSIKSIWTKYPKFGGVMGWEYFNSITDRSGKGRPWEWAKYVDNIYGEVEREKKEAEDRKKAEEAKEKREKERAARRKALEAEKEQQEEAENDDDDDDDDEVDYSSYESSSGDDMRVVAATRARKAAGSGGKTLGRKRSRLIQIFDQDEGF